MSREGKTVDGQDFTESKSGEQSANEQDNGVIKVKMRQNGIERSIVNNRLQHLENERALHTRMTQSQLLASPGPVATFLFHMYPGVMVWLKEKKLIPKWYNLDLRLTSQQREGEVKSCGQRRALFGQYPASVLSPQNMLNTLTFQWTSWGYGKADNSKEQLLNEQGSIALVSALVLTVTVPFLANLLTPYQVGSDDFFGDDDNTVYMNFPSNFPDLNWIIVNCMTISYISYMLSTILAMFMMLAVNEVGTAENVQILEDWMGQITQLIPVAFFMGGSLTFIAGIGFWVVAIYRTCFSLFLFIALAIIIGSTYLVWFFNLVSSVWLTLAQGTDKLEKGLHVQRKRQSIDTQALRGSLKKYVQESHGAENIDLNTFKTRLKIIDFEKANGGEDKENGGEDKEIIELGNITETIAEALFEYKVDNEIELALASSGAPSTQSRTRRAESVAQKKQGFLGADEVQLSEAERIEENDEVKRTVQSPLKHSNAQRTITYDLISEIEKERALRIRMVESQQKCPLSPDIFLFKKLKLIKWAKGHGLIPEWFDPYDENKQRTQFEWNFYRPASYLAPRNIFDFFSFQWLTWCRGTAEEQKEQVIAEQEDISLVSALLATVGASYLLVVITTNGINVTNFPTFVSAKNYTILNSLAMGTFGYILSTFTAVFLIMAVNEVSGTVENVPVLLEWLGPLRLFPVWIATLSIMLLVIGVVVLWFSFYDPSSGTMMYQLIFTISLVFAPFQMTCAKITNSVFMTLARGEVSVDEGYDIARRTQCITALELKQELDLYIEEAKGVENVNLNTYKLRLQIIEPVRNTMGKTEKIMVKLGHVTERLAENIFNQRVEEAIDEAFAQSKFWKQGPVKRK